MPLSILRGESLRLLDCVTGAEGWDGEWEWEWAVTGRDYIYINCKLVI